MDDESGGSSPDVDEALTALSDARRRQVLYRLRDRNGTATVDDLRRHLSERADADADSVDVGLRHVVIPHLRDAGVVAYDPADERVEYRGGPLVDELVEHLAEYEATGTDG